MFLELFSSLAASLKKLLIHFNIETALLCFGCPTMSFDFAYSYVFKTFNNKFKFIKVDTLLVNVDMNILIKQFQTCSQEKPVSVSFKYTSFHIHNL